MNDKKLARKWDRSSVGYDLVNGAEQARLEPFKRSLFAQAKGRVLLIGAGTGHDFALLPPGLDVIAIDISEKMVERAGLRVKDYCGNLQVRRMDVRELEFSDAYFDVALASCVFCSVPEPARGLHEVRRVLKPQGQLLMVEHVRSRIGAIALMQDLMTTLSSFFGPQMNRDTVGTLLRSGYRLDREENLYLDIIKAIAATPQ